MKKLLVTGAAGYIGSIACLEFLRNGFEVVAVDNLSAGYRSPIEILEKEFGTKAIRFYQYDLRDTLDELFKKEKNIDAVIHFAGVCIIDESMKNPSKYFSNNFIASQNLLDTMVRFSIHRIIFSSSCSVYRDTQARFYRENSPLQPSNPYGESKLLVEKVLAWYSQIFDLQYITLRYFNVCGAENDGIFGDSKNPSHLLVHNAIQGALQLRPFYVTCPTFETEDRSPVRDYVNVLDLIDAHIKSLTYFEHANDNQTLNLGTGIGYSVYEVIKKVEEITKKTLPIQKKNVRLGEYSTRVASNKKAKKVLDWKPRYSLDDSIQSALRWYTKTRRWKN
jgi:UDP-glucose 4-epimerase